MFRLLQDLRPVERLRLTPLPPCLSASAEAIVAEPALNVLADLPRAAAARAHSSSSAVEGLDALYLAELRGRRGRRRRSCTWRATAGARISSPSWSASSRPELEVAVLPAWDCLPYDRVSPNADIMARRLDALARLLERVTRGRAW